MKKRIQRIITCASAALLLGPAPFSTAQVPHDPTGPAPTGDSTIIRHDFDGVLFRAPFDEGTGATTVSAPEKVAATVPENASWQPGRKGTSCLAFDGSGLPLVFEPGALLSFGLEPREFTVEAWIYREKNGDFGFIASKPDEFVLRTVPWDKSRVDFAVYDEEKGYTNVTSEANVLRAGEWQHVAGVAAADGISVYVNGQLVGEQKTPIKARTLASPLVVGGHPDGEGEYIELFTGLIEDLTVLAGAKTAEDFADLRAEFTEDFDRKKTGIVVPPVTKSVAFTATPSAPEMTVGSDKSLSVENAFYKAVFSPQPSFGLSSFRNKMIGAELLATEGTPVPPFAIQRDGALLPAGSFSVRDITISEHAGVKEAAVLLVSPEHGVEATLRIAADSGEGLTWKLEVGNTGGQAFEALVTFPLLDTVLFGDIQDNWFFFPMHTGWMGNRNYMVGQDYGRRCWMQLLFAHNPELGGGVSLRSLDAEGRVKGMLAKKGGPSAGNIDVTYNIMFTPLATPLTAFRQRPGIGLSISYLPRRFLPGTAEQFPDARIAAYAGEVTVPVADYGRWAREALPPRGATPRWFMDDFNFVNVHPRGGNAGWSAGFAGAGRFDLSSQLAPDGSDQHLQLGGWWLAPSPRDTAATGFGGGDYDFNEQWGGAAAMRSEIAKAAERGTRVSLYMNQRTISDDSRIRREKGDRWAYLLADGTPSRDWGTFNVSPLNHEWQDHLADKVAAALRETGADGVYLDTAAEVVYCSSDRYPRDEDPVRSEARMLAEVRSHVRAAGEDKVLWVEHCGSDYFSRYVDGSWAQTYANPHAANFSNYDIHFFRFAFPEVKLAEWGMTAELFDVDMRRAFFNGVGIARGDLEPAQAAQLAAVTRNMREVADCFASPAPRALVPSAAHGISINEFPLENRVLWTVYNKTDRPYRGRLFASRPAGAKPGSRFIDTTDGRILPLEDGEVAVDLEPYEVAAILAVEPRFDIVAEDGKLWLQSLPGGAPVTGSPVRLEIRGETPRREEVAQDRTLLGNREDFGTGGVAVRLLQDGYLVDLCAWNGSP